MLHPPHTPVATSLCILLISIYENFDLYGRGNLCIYEDGMGQKSNADKTMDIARYATVTRPNFSECKQRQCTSTDGIFLMRVQ